MGLPRKHEGRPVAGTRTGSAVRQRRQPGTGESHGILSDQRQDLTNAIQEFIMSKSSQRSIRLADDSSCPIPAEPTQEDRWCETNPIWGPPEGWLSALWIESYGGIAWKMLPAKQSQLGRSLKREVGSVTCAVRNKAKRRLPVAGRQLSGGGAPDKRSQFEGSSATNGEPTVRNKANFRPALPNHQSSIINRQSPGTASGGQA